MMDWNVLRNDWEQACSRRGESATVSTVDTLSSVFREIAGARELSGISKESVEVNDVELFAADEFVDQLKEMRSYGIDGRPIVLHDTLPISPIIDASHVVVVNLLVWGRSGLEQLPASVAGRALLCVCRANDGELLGVSETVFQS